MAAPSSGVDRRTAMKLGAGLLGAAAFAKALAPLTELTAETSVAEFLQKHYKRMSVDEMAAVLARLEAETSRDYGADVSIEDVRPIPGVQFGYALNLSVCIGCRRCADACHEENNHDRATNNSYIRVFEIEQGSLEFEHGTVNYDHAVPAPGKFYMPVQCHQCDNPPCVDVCPVEATWKEEDGIVVIDYN